MRKATSGSRIVTTAAPNKLSIEPNLTMAVKRVERLMAISGRSGEEAEVAEYIRSQLLAAGAKESQIHVDKAHRKTPLPGNTGNLVLRLPGTVRGSRRLLMAHMDTVPLCVGAIPKREGDFIRSANPQTGLGADDRAGVAVILTAALEILRRDVPHPPLTFLWCIQEEVGLYGARFLSPAFLGNPKLAFNWDGGLCEKITLGATGAYRLAIDIRGKASHAGVAPEQGVSAIAIAGRAIDALSRGLWHGLVERNGKRGTTNIGIVRGGEATNVVTDHVFLKAETRSHDRAFRTLLADTFEKAFHTAAAEVKNAKGESGVVHVERTLDYESFELPADSASVLAAEAAVRSIGLEPQRSISHGGLDANWMFQHGIPTVTLGCGQRDVHTTAERLAIPDFENACRIAMVLATARETA